MSQFLLLTVSLLLRVLVIRAGEPSVEMNLIQNLTANYDVNARPVADAADTVPVEIGIALQQIIDLNEPTQILTTSVFLRIFWTDAALTWDPADYNNLTSIRLTVTRIWRPDITLYNDVSTDRRNVEALYPASVSNTGRVAWLTPTIFISSCTLNMRYFPWDYQECILELGSWTYDASALAANPYGDGGDITAYIENGEWHLEGLPSEKISAYYQCCPDPYESIIFTIKVTRKPMYYLVNIVLPCVFVSFVGLLVFLLPPTSGEKVSLSVTVLLASTVFLLIVAEALPPQSTTIPLVSQYFEAVICLLAMTTVVSVFIINIHHRGEAYPPPHRILRLIFFDVLARVVCMRSLVVQKDQSEKQNATTILCRPASSDKTRLFTTQVHPLNNGFGPNHTSQNEKVHISDHHETPLDTLKADGLDKTTTDGLLHGIWSELRSLSRGGSEIGDVEPLEMDSEKQWVFIAMILDRIFLVIFLSVTSITSLTILLDRK